jgi:DsbC/DsbD-like thiol-disulfide interchange protein
MSETYLQSREVRFELAIIWFVFVCTPIWARAAEPEHLKIELLADTGAVVPGKPFWLGVQFEPEPGWHIYWTNPGDSGEPPKFTWELPAGFRAEPIQWLAPTRLGSGTVIDFGYDRSVLLPIEIHPPAALPLGNRLEFQLKMTWLVCREVCVPGKGDLVIFLPAQRTALAPDPESHKAFAAARSHLPKPAPRRWDATAVSEKDTFVVIIHGAWPSARMLFFPLDSDEIDNAAPQKISEQPGSVRLELKKSEQLVKTPAVLRGVLETGTGAAYQIEAPVR